MALKQAAIWFIGEYGELLLEPYKDPRTINRNYGKKAVVDSVIEFDGIPASEIIHTLTTLHSTNLPADTAMMLLTCCMKLAVRLDEDQLPHIRMIVEPYQSSTDIEVQQRACELD